MGVGLLVLWSWLRIVSLLWAGVAFFFRRGGLFERRGEVVISYL